MNYSDSERIETYMEALEFDKTDEINDADIILLNTCSIKQKAEDKVFGKMRELKQIKAKKDLIVVITGCMVRESSSRYSEKRDPLFPRVKELDIALRTEELPKLAELLREINPAMKIEEIEEESLEDYLKIDATHSSNKTNAQALLPISNGCDKFCTYCIVPYSRGREKSRKMEDILKEAEKLTENGCKEITLIGQTVNSYGLSNYDKENKTFIHLKKEPFVHLLEELDKLEGLQRVRFTSPHPKDMSDQLIDAMAELRTQMPYLHLPLQAGDNETLKRMNRPYTIEKYGEIIKKLREKIPNISISTDIIVGFCGETEEEYQNTYDRFKSLGFEHAYIAQYSDRKGTTANRFMKDDIPTETKRERWDAINELLKVHSAEALERFIGKTVNVLVEDQDGDLCTGRSENFKTVQFHAKENLLGQIVPVRITGKVPWVLKGEMG